MLELARVGKAFGDRRALDDVSLAVESGEMLALLGHNGAGKSTLFGLVLGLLRLDAGDVRVRGVSVAREPRRARIGVGSMLAPAFYEYLSGRDNLRAFTSYSGPIAPAEAAAAIRFVGLDDRIDDRVRTYSHGMRRRLALALALLPRPDLLLLDEWEAGLDPEGTDAMRALIVRINREHGTTVVVSSHRPAAVHAMCARVAILRQGRLVFDGRWDDLDGPAARVRLGLDDWERAAPVLARLGAARDGDGVVALAATTDPADLVAALVEAGVRVGMVEPVRRSPDDRYLRALTGDGIPGRSRP